MLRKEMKDFLELEINNSEKDGYPILKVYNAELTSTTSINGNYSFSVRFKRSKDVDIYDSTRLNGGDLKYLIGFKRFPGASKVSKFIETEDGLRYIGLALARDKQRRDEMGY